MQIFYLKNVHQGIVEQVLLMLTSRTTKSGVFDINNPNNKCYRKQI